MNFKITSEAKELITEKGGEITTRIEKKLTLG